jgi:outer membrane murein-binding lipoprotein Lpp
MYILARKIEEISITALVISILGVVVMSALMYLWLSDLGHGIVSMTGSTAPITLADSLYFSVVTISTLGYGDFRPVSYARFVVVGEVISGLVLIALTVSKLASDRTATYVRLLYSSDSERRLKEITSDIQARVHSLRAAQRDHNHDQRLDDIRRIGLITVNLAKYYEYQVKVGALGEEWARKNSLRVVRAITKAAEQLAAAGKAELVTTAERHRIETAFLHIQRAIEVITKKHTSEDFSAAKLHIERTVQSYVKYAESGMTKANYSEVIPYIVSQVKRILPAKPWPKNIHKEVAAKLRISNRLAHRTITEIEKTPP